MSLRCHRHRLVQQKRPDVLLHDGQHGLRAMVQRQHHFRQCHRQPAHHAISSFVPKFRREWTGCRFSLARRVHLVAAASGVEAIEVPEMAGPNLQPVLAAVFFPILHLEQRKSTEPAARLFDAREKWV